MSRRTHLRLRIHPNPARSRQAGNSAPRPDRGRRRASPCVDIRGGFKIAPCRGAAANSVPRTASTPMTVPTLPRNRGPGQCPPSPNPCRIFGAGSGRRDIPGGPTQRSPAGHRRPERVSCDLSNCARTSSACRLGRGGGICGRMRTESRHRRAELLDHCVKKPTQFSAVRILAERFTDRDMVPLWGI